MQKKYGETVAGIKTKQLVLDYIAHTGQKMGAFYDIAVREKIERDCNKERTRDWVYHGTSSLPIPSDKPTS